MVMFSKFTKRQAANRKHMMKKGFDGMLTWVKESRRLERIERMKNIHEASRRNLQVVSSMRTENEIKAIMEWMTSFKIFPSDIPQNMLRTLCKGMENKNMSKNEVLFLQGDPSGQFYIIIEGELQLAIQDSPEEEIRLRLKRDDDPEAFRSTDFSSGAGGIGKFLKVLKSGIAFGELSMMDDTQRTTAVFCLSETAQLCVVNRDLYNQTLRNFHKNRAGAQALYSQISELRTFKSWVPEVRQHLVDASTVTRFTRGSYITEIGSKIDHMNIIISGEVSCLSEKRKKVATNAIGQPIHDDDVHALTHSHHKKDNTQAELCGQGPGTLIGDIEVFSNMKYYCLSCFVKSADCIVATLPLEAFLSLAKISKTVYNQLCDNALLKKEWFGVRYKEEKSKNNRIRREVKRKKIQGIGGEKNLRDLNKMTIIEKIEKEKKIVRKEREDYQRRHGHYKEQAKLPEIVRLHELGVLDLGERYIASPDGSVRGGSIASSYTRQMSPSNNSVGSDSEYDDLSVDMSVTSQSTLLTQSLSNASLAGGGRNAYSWLQNTTKRTKRVNNMDAGYHTDPTFNRYPSMAHNINTPIRNILKPRYGGPLPPAVAYSGSAISLNHSDVDFKKSLAGIIARDQLTSDLRGLKTGRLVSTAIMRPVKGISKP
jgi:CRP-like cAMP-binding protein